MDRIDLMVFRSLFQGELPDPLSMDPRKSLRAIARNLGIDELTVRNRLRRLQSEGFLKGWFLFVNPALLGMDLVQVLVEPKKSKRNGLIEGLRDSPSVTAIIEHLAGSIWVAFVCDSERARDSQVELIEKLAGAKASALLKVRFPNCDLKLSRTDVQIITALSRYPRKLYSDVAKELAISSRTVRRRLERLVEGKAIFVIPSMDPSALEGSLMADLLVEYSGREDYGSTNQQILSKLDNHLVRAQLGDQRYGFFNLFITKVSTTHEILGTVKSIKGVRDARIDLVQDRLEMPDRFYGDRDGLEHLAKTKLI